MSVIVGDRMRGAAGATVAVSGLMIPGMIVVMTLGVVWDSQRHNPNLRAFLIGVASAAVGLLLTVTIQLGHKQFARFPDVLFIAATFAAVSIFNISLVKVLLVVAPVAILYYHPRGDHVASAQHLLRLRQRLLSHRADWRH
jgi:chromate transporter